MRNLRRAPARRRSCRETWKISACKPTSSRAPRPRRPSSIAHVDRLPVVPSMWIAPVLPDDLRGLYAVFGRYCSEVGRGGKRFGEHLRAIRRASWENPLRVCCAALSIQELAHGLFASASTDSHGVASSHVGPNRGLVRFLLPFEAGFGLGLHLQAGSQRPEADLKGIPLGPPDHRCQSAEM